tara:strand:+ start:46 stop:267 length:222 start_codon:yes stop_codon:yes gene_type:complete
MEQQDMFDQLLNGHIEDGKPELEPFYDEYGRKFYPSKYSEPQAGWFWNLEVKGYQRWQDMMDWYEEQKSEKHT